MTKSNSGKRGSHQHTLPGHLREVKQELKAVAGSSNHGGILLADSPSSFLG